MRKWGLAFLAVLLLLLPALAEAQGPGGGPPPWAAEEMGSGPGKGWGEVSSPEAATSATWQIERVDVPHRFGRMGSRSLALDAAGHPHIAYGGKALYYAHFDGTSWQVEVVDSSRNVGQDTSMALDALGRPHISYYDETNGDLKYACRGVCFPRSRFFLPFIFRGFPPAVEEVYL